MAFVNEKLTSKEREEFLKAGIKSPRGGYQSVVVGIKPTHLTIDRDTNTWLAYHYSHRETDKDVQEFIFMYKGITIPLQAVRNFSQNTGTYWQITLFDLPNEFVEEKNAIEKLVIDSFETYNSSGWPEDINPKIKTTCAFAKEVI
jgi:hypothetical protein